MPAEGHAGEPARLSAQEIARELALLRDGSQDAGRRAFAAAALAAGSIQREQNAAADAAQRMFGFDRQHAGAREWDGSGSHLGTITYVDDERVEQYIGQQQWIAYRRGELGDFRSEVGDQVRVVRRGNAVVIETAGPNRVHTGSSAALREASSGMLVLRTTAITWDEMESCAQAVAARYGAVASTQGQRVWIEFRGGEAQLAAVATEHDVFVDHSASALLGEPIAAGIRLAVRVRSNALDAALAAERALMLFAAIISSEAEALAIDDTGAILSAAALYTLGTRNEMRADAFIFAAAAAQGAYGAAPAQFSNRVGVGDELTVLSSRPWSAVEAAAFLARELRALDAASRLYEDAVIPNAEEWSCAEVLSSDQGRGALDGLQPLASLRYGTVEVDIGFLNLGWRGEEARAGVAVRKDIEAIIGPIASGVVVAFGNSGPDTESERFGLEMRRAEALASALAAALARRGDSVATDLNGTLYSADELLELALRRSGKSTSWAARVAALVPSPAIATFDRTVS